MGIEDPDGVGDAEDEQGSQPAADEGSEHEVAPIEPSGFRLAKGIEDMLGGPSAMSSIERALESFTTANSAYESMKRFLDQSPAVAAAERLQSDLAQFVNAASGASVVAANLRWLDQLTPLDKYVSQYAVTSRIAEQIAGSGALSSWRSALAANSLIEARLRELTAPLPLFSELARISRTQVDLTDWVVQRAPGSGLLSETSGQPALAWRNLVSDSVDDPDDLATMVATGRTNLSLLGSDLLTAPDVDPALIAEGADRIESEVVEPWMAARLEIISELYAALSAIDPKVPELLNGAWDDVRRDGPAAAEKAANCTVEAVERSLRGAAPDEAVRVWHKENNRPAKEWAGQDRPPHALRVKYLVRNLGGPRALVESQADAFASVVGRLRGQLQGTKHASRSDLITVRTLLTNAENLLISVFLSQDNEGH